MTETPLCEHPDVSRHTCSGRVAGYVNYVSIKPSGDRRGRACPALRAGREARGQAEWGPGALGSPPSTHPRLTQLPAPGVGHGASTSGSVGSLGLAVPQLCSRTNQQNLGSHESQEVGGYSHSRGAFQEAPGVGNERKCGVPGPGSLLESGGPREGGSWGGGAQGGQKAGSPPNMGLWAAGAVWALSLQRAPRPGRRAGGVGALPQHPAVICSQSET